MTNAAFAKDGPNYQSREIKRVSNKLAKPSRGRAGGYQARIARRRQRRIRGNPEHILSAGGRVGCQPGNKAAASSATHRSAPMWRSWNCKPANSPPTVLLASLKCQLPKGTITMCESTIAAAVEIVFYGGSWFWRFAGRCRGTLASLARLAHCRVAVLPNTPRFARRRTYSLKTFPEPTLRTPGEHDSGMGWPLVGRVSACGEATSKKQYDWKLYRKMQYEFTGSSSTPLQPDNLDIAIGVFDECGHRSSRRSFPDPLGSTEHTLE
ncbi:hypothetical protein MSG28_013780 [Choristoneura fumiferana]|uniref:Uncharacterized protein n=1 Tax=Choristoneura fumiferana TaxID=7141 RepID=A0ACC0K902_CHOFU|nr:hypothetical protein MSG28_013780 [Choristoneura fumiferana]